VHLCRAAHQTLFSSSGYFWRLKCSESDDIRLVIAFNSQPRPVRKCDAARDWRKTNGRLVTSVAFDAAACVLPERKRARGLLSSTTSIGVVCFSARRCASALLTIALRPYFVRTAERIDQAVMAYEEDSIYCNSVLYDLPTSLHFSQYRTPLRGSYLVCSVLLCSSAFIGCASLSAFPSNWQF